MGFESHLRALRDLQGNNQGQLYLSAGLYTRVLHPSILFMAHINRQWCDYESF